MISANAQIGRGGKIRTCDLTVPNRAHCQAVLRPGLDVVSYEKHHQASDFTGENENGQVGFSADFAKKSRICRAATVLWLISFFTES